MKIEELNIDIRVRNGLWSEGIYDVEDLSLWTAKDLATIPNFGWKISYNLNRRFSQGESLFYRKRC